MSSKKAKPKPQSKTKTSTISKVGAVAKAGASMLGIGGTSAKKGSGKKKGKKSALWYAREIQRVKLKRKLEKLKLGGMR